ncbi:glycosyltransferase family 4 protein [Macellibacteroides fermentans]|uniref:glycosyltransferase family 4 protein n=1 Tax=Macellibacteroides fermentans TaxID=879969 RepID=UPI00406C62EF
MNVLILLLTAPELESNPNLYTELIEEFRDKGHQVYAVAMDEKKHMRNSRLIHEEGIHKLYVRTGNFFNVSPIIKGITTARIGDHFINAIKKFLPDIKFDLVLMPTPPITFATVLGFLKKRDRAICYLILRDIFPQNAKDIGLMKNPFIFQYFRSKEKKMYQTADYIGCMSQGNINYVLEHNPEVNKNKMRLLPNWARVQKKQDELQSQIPALQKVPGDSFKCIFGGNIGWAQNLEFLIELADEVREYKDIIFIIAGSGVEKKKIQLLAEKKGLNNIVFMGNLTRSEYDSLVQNCNVGLINLDRRFTIPNIPSKTTGYFNAEIPILASIDPNTDYGRILEESGAGLWSVTGDMETYKSNLLYLYHNKDIARGMGRKGKEYLSNNLTTEKAYWQIVEDINKPLKEYRESK